MNINKNITIDLSTDDIKQIIVDYLIKEGFNTTIDNVNFNIRSLCTGYGLMESYSYVLDGCQVKCK